MVYGLDWAVNTTNTTFKNLSSGVCFVYQNNTFTVPVNDYLMILNISLLCVNILFLFYGERVRSLFDKAFKREPSDAVLSDVSQWGEHPKED